MQRPTPKVTVGVAVYNGEAYLAGALESVLAQTYDDFELVISDNGSTDDTEMICRRFARRDARVRYYRSEENRGAAWNFNRVFELARGEYFKWMAHDDQIAPEFVAACVAELDADPDIVWCQSQIVLIDDAGRPLSGNINAWNNPNAPRCDVHSVQSFDPGGRRGDRSSTVASERFAAVLLGAAWCLDCYGLIRTSALRKTRGYLATYGAEKITVGELSLQGRYVEVPQPLKFVRIHEAASGGLTATSDQQRFMGERRFSRWLNPRLQLCLDQAVTPLCASLPLGERLRCMAAVGRYVFQVRKWGSVIRSLLLRNGTGGANAMFLPDEDGDTPDASESDGGGGSGRVRALAHRVVGGTWMIAVMEESLPLL